jgi:hypothetical protein
VVKQTIHTNQIIRSKFILNAIAIIIIVIIQTPESQQRPHHEHEMIWNDFIIFSKGMRNDSKSKQKSGFIWCV